MTESLFFYSFQLFEKRFWNCLQEVVIVCISSFFNFFQTLVYHIMMPFFSRKPRSFQLFAILIPFFQLRKPSKIQFWHSQSSHMPLKCKNSFVNTHFLIKNSDFVAHLKPFIHFSMFNLRNFCLQSGIFDQFLFKTLSKTVILSFFVFSWKNFKSKA